MLKRKFAMAPSAPSFDPHDPSKFDAYASSYRQHHASSIRTSGEPPEYFALYKIGCLERAGVPAHAKVLDFGCGTGNLTAPLSARMPHVHGYDPSPESLKVARERAPSATLHERIEDAPHDFEVAVLSGVLHHVSVPERLDLMKRVYDHLRPGGRVFVFEHNPFNPLTQHAVATCEFDDDAILLWPWELRRLLTSSGFSPVQLDYIVFFPKALARLRSAEPYLKRLPLGAQTLTVGARP